MRRIVLLLLPRVRDNEANSAPFLPRVRDNEAKSAPLPWVRGWVTRRRVLLSLG